MGKSRARQHQGMPDALDESKLKKKRKADESGSAQAGKNKKRKKPAFEDAKPAPKRSRSKLGSDEKTSDNNNRKKKPASKDVAKARKDLFGSEGEDEEFTGLGDDSDAASDMSLDLKDDFLAGGDSDSDVFDWDEENGPRPIFSEDEDESDADEKLTAANIVGLTRKLDAQRKAEEEEAVAELQEAAMQTNIAEEKVRILGATGEEEDESLQPADITMLRTRITDTIRVLEDFKKLGEEGRSRAEYTAQLLKDICSYYGYSEFLAEKLYKLFSPSEAFSFFEANEKQRPIVIRTNTLKTARRELAQALISRGVTLEPVGKWSKVGLQVFESSIPLGATPEYLAGHYILQAASSFLPVMALAPQEHERVLDMAAAPGGKTTYISALMKNTGTVFANDPSRERSRGLIGNIHRMGVRNTVVCNCDAREFPKAIGGFDRVLLDAPCSGTGVIAKDHKVKTNKDEKDFIKLPHLQKQLLLCAIDSVDHASSTGGYIVYSTCSVTIEENEQVVQYALNKRPNVKLVETGLTFGKEGFCAFRGKTFDPKMKSTRRYYPHMYNVDGFFVAKFKKTGPTPLVKPDAAGESKEMGVDDLEGPEDDIEFGGFDEEEDQKAIEQGERNRRRSKGVDPDAKPSASQKKEENSKSEVNVSDEKKDNEKKEKEKDSKKMVEKDRKPAKSKEAEKKSKPKSSPKTKTLPFKKKEDKLHLKNQMGRKKGGRR